MKVTLVSRSISEVEGVVDYSDFIAFIARIGRVKENSEKLVNYLLEHKHFSPFEHAFFTFKIETSRAIGRELLRHRSFVFQERSQRYEKVSVGDFELRQQAEKNRQSSTDVIEDPELKQLVQEYLAYSQEVYEKLLEKNVARECARFVLPESTETTILMTGNIRSWYHFMQLRLDETAQKEIREVAQEIKNILSLYLPRLF